MPFAATEGSIESVAPAKTGTADMFESAPVAADVNATFGVEPVEPVVAELSPTPADALAEGQESLAFEPQVLAGGAAPEAAAAPTEFVPAPPTAATTATPEESPSRTV
jgi:hypothetical protein